MYSIIQDWGKKTEITLAEFWDFCKYYFIYNMFVMYVERNKIMRTQKLGPFQDHKIYKKRDININIVMFLKCT